MVIGRGRAVFSLCALLGVTQFNASPAHAGEKCDPTTEGEVFTAVAEKAKDLACNTHGFWEAGFGDLEVFVYIPGGTFTMGDDRGLDDEAPAHEVQQSAYWIAKYPVTVGQFRRFITATGHITDAERGWGSWQWTGQRIDTPGTDHDAWYPQKDGRWDNIYFDQVDNHPVGSVSWNDANHYADWLTGKLGIDVVLPTESQWEKAARGTDGRLFPWGNELPDGRKANFADRNFAEKYGRFARRPDLAIDDGYVETSPVDAYPEGQSPYGVFDLAGNLGEWVFDVYDSGAYRSDERSDPSGPPPPAEVPDKAIDRVNRGGSWVDWAGVDRRLQIQPEGGHSIRASARTGDEQNSSDDHMGFRLAVDGRRKAVVKPVNPDLPDLEGVEIAVHTARENVLMLEASGDVAGNIAVLTGPDGLLIVDDQFAELVPLIEARLIELDSGPLRYILNTHHHDDHSDGNARLSAGEAVIVAHDRTYLRLADRPPGQRPDISFSDALTVHFNGEVVRLYAIPGGHTDNDVVVFSKMRMRSIWAT